MLALLHFLWNVMWYLILGGSLLLGALFVLATVFGPVRR